MFLSIQVSVNVEDTNTIIFHDGVRHICAEPPNPPASTTLRAAASISRRDEGDPLVMVSWPALAKVPNYP